MRQFDLTPLYRSTVGFDRLASMFDSLSGRGRDGSGYPPYNIERLDENSYRISMAVAGFGQDDLSVEVKENELTVGGKKPVEAEESSYLHRGIAARSFERRFQLADHVEVTNADLRDGMLHIDLKRELPEAMKARTIKIGADASQKTIEAGV